jgi:eukaryotic-like serine/threonine-protein kinase
MRCPACRHDVVEASQFCPSCGARIGSSNAATQTVAAIESYLHTGALDGAQFAPGTLLNGRYRIVGLIGRGGMGEVYRADDLTLSQPVALKFLPKQMADRPGQLERFRAEVRLARQISHPNVCRVHDIAEATGQVFLSMEYVDGEDLASLLRRIGRLPQDKALDIARQLCVGLAAAHASKVLHRDLKPANVLIDGRGQAHLADFGLADFTGRRRGTAEVAGTPGYMAPEQLDGRELSTRTDLHALGLVMYEMFTGKRALSADGAASDRLRTWTPPASPSTHVPDLDPAIDRIIMRCLEPDPARRPASAVAVAAALPGGNVLAAMIAAGETPSPETVAAAGEPGTITPTVAALCLCGVLGGLIGLSLTLRDVSLIGLTNPERTPQALTERAHNVVRSLGYLDTPADEAIGFTTDIDYLRDIDELDQSPTRWRQLGDAQPPALLFWYRQGSRRLDPIGGATIVTRVNPPETRSGMLSLLLDRSGRLVSLLAVRDSNNDADEHASSAATGWSRVFSEAGLPIERFSPVTPRSIPPVYADARAAWSGAYPERLDVPITIEAAALEGRPVYFEIFAPWTRPHNEGIQPGTTSGERVSLLIRTVVSPLALGVALVLAVRNLRLARGDRRGAMRVALFMGAAGMVSVVLESGNLDGLSRGPTLVFFVPAAMWVLYIALEPHLRRIWPGVMIGWSRLLAGQVRDPLVGRDILVGVLVAIGNGLVMAVHAALRRWSGHVPSFPTGASADPFVGMAASSDFLLGGRYAVSRVVGALTNIPALIGTMATFLLLFVLFVVFRRRFVAIAVMLTLLTGFYIVAHGGWLLANAPPDHFRPSPGDAVLFAIVQSAVVAVAIRFGLLTMLVASILSGLLTTVPIVLSSSPPYAASSWLVVGAVLGLAVYGWYTALAGRHSFI